MVKNSIPTTPIRLWQDFTPGFHPEFGQPEPSLTPYILDTPQPAGLVVVLPGGGYVMKAPHEAEPIARWLNQAGVSATVVDYRVTPYHHPIPMQDAKRAIQLVRSHAGIWGIDPSHIGLLGFSAGGHLASTVGTHLDPDEQSTDDPVKRMSARPDALILCYPVISFGPYGHSGSMVSLLGEKPDAALVKNLCNETQVTSNTPPSFLWHTADDVAVPVENSLAYVAALKSCQVPFELHIFPNGSHGLGLAIDNAVVGQWTGLCENWLRNLGFMG